MRLGRGTGRAEALTGVDAWHGTQERRHCSRRFTAALECSALDVPFQERRSILAGIRAVRVPGTRENSLGNIVWGGEEREREGEEKEQVCACLQIYVCVQRRVWYQRYMSRGGARAGCTYVEITVQS